MIDTKSTLLVTIIVILSCNLFLFLLTLNVALKRFFIFSSMLLKLVVLFCSSFCRLSNNSWTIGWTPSYGKLQDLLSLFYFWLYYIFSHINTYECKECGMFWPTPSALKTHFAYRHSDVSIYRDNIRYRNDDWIYTIRDING